MGVLISIVVIWKEENGNSQRHRLSYNWSLKQRACDVNEAE